jgi:hypothetical protein
MGYDYKEEYNKGFKDGFVEGMQEGLDNLINQLNSVQEKANNNDTKLQKLEEKVQRLPMVFSGRASTC